MTLKNWFYKLMGEDTKRRLWAIALVNLLFFFSYPVVIVFLSGTRTVYESHAKWLAEFSEMAAAVLSKANGWIAFLIAVLAVVCGISGFSWLDSRKKVDFYHSIPVRREKLFFANYINGILIVAIPLLGYILLGAALAAGQGVGPGIFMEGLKSWVYFMTYYLLLYSTAVIAVIMTGNIIVSLLGVGVFFFYGPLAVVLTEGYYSTWFFTYYDAEGFLKWARRVSPFIDYCQGGTLTWKFFLTRLAIGILLTLIALVLYKKRPSEAAGKAMAFSVSKPIIRILIVLVSAMGGAIFCWSLRERMGWAIFGLVTASVIAHCVIEIIYHFDFKKLFSHYRQLIGCIAVSVVVLAAFRLDWFHYDSYIPKESSITSAAVDIYGLDNWMEYGRLESWEQADGKEDYQFRTPDTEWEEENPRPYIWVGENRTDHLFREMKLTDLPTILEIARHGADRAKERRKTEMGNFSPYFNNNVQRNNTEYVNLVIQYRLGSRTVCRKYSADRKLIEENIRAIFDSIEYKKGAYPILAMSEEDVVLAEIEQDGEVVQVEGQKAKELFQAYEKALTEMSQEEIQDQIPVGTVRFLDARHKDILTWEKELERKGGTNYYYRSYIQKEKYPVYESFSQVKELLKEEEKELEARKSQRVIGKIALSDSRSYRAEGGWNTGMTIEVANEEEIQELCPLLLSQQYLSYNNFFRNAANHLEAEVYEIKEGYKTEEDYDRGSYVIPVKEVPEKYLERLQYDTMTAEIEAFQEKED